jgi:hypothetical protein
VGKRGEQSNLDRRSEIRSTLIKSKPPDLERTPEIERLAVRPERGGAARSRGESSPETRGMATAGLQGLRERVRCVQDNTVNTVVGIMPARKHQRAQTAAERSCGGTNLLR